MILRRLFSLKSGALFSSLNKETWLPPPKDFLKYECELYLKQPSTPPQCKIIAAYRTLYHRLAIETGQSSTIPNFGDDRLCHFCSYDVGEIEALVGVEWGWSVPYITPLEKFQTLFQKIILGSLKSFFQLDHQVEISLYLTEATALRHSWKLGGLTPSWCTFSPISLLGPLYTMDHEVGSLKIPLFHGPTWWSNIRSLISLKNWMYQAFGPLTRCNPNVHRKMNVLIWKIFSKRVVLEKEEKKESLTILLSSLVFIFASPKNLIKHLLYQKKICRGPLPFVYQSTSFASPTTKPVEPCQ